MFAAKDINGTIVKSYIACARQGWLASRKLTPLLSDVNIQMGTAYASIRNKNSRKFGNIEIDAFTHQKSIVIKEYKKSFSNIESSRMQILFYMKTIKEELGLKKVEGFIISETTDEKKYIKYGESENKEVEKLISDILLLVNNRNAPIFEKKELCNYCAHKLYCL